MTRKKLSEIKNKTTSFQRWFAAKVVFWVALPGPGNSEIIG
jgi:hypothetical protein